MHDYTTKRLQWQDMQNTTTYVRIVYFLCVALFAFCEWQLLSKFSFLKAFKIILYVKTAEVLYFSRFFKAAGLDWLFYIVIFLPSVKPPVLIGYFAINSDVSVFYIWANCQTTKKHQLVKLSFVSVVLFHLSNDENGCVWE